GLWRSFQTIVCSRPPRPTTRMFIGSNALPAITMFTWNNPCSAPLVSCIHLYSAPFMPCFKHIFIHSHPTPLMTRINHTCIHLTHTHNPASFTPYIIHAHNP